MADDHNKMVWVYVEATQGRLLTQIKRGVTYSVHKTTDKSCLRLFPRPPSRRARCQSQD